MEDSEGKVGQEDMCKIWGSISRREGVPEGLGKVDLDGVELGREHGRGLR